MAGAVGAGAFLEQYKPFIAEVFAQAADEGVKLVWIQGQTDTGCSVSLLQGNHPDLYDAVMKLNVNIAYHPTVMVPSGEDAVGVLKTVEPDILVVEGAIPTGDKKYACTIGYAGGEHIVLEDYLKEVAARTKVGIVAVGACATHGGIPAGYPNPTNAKGVSEVLGKTVINLPGCPPQPDHVFLTLASVILGVVPELDGQGRPKAFYSRLLHDECPRRGYYNEAKFAKEFGDEECLYKVGCRGPVTYADCASRKWNGGVNMCTNAGAPCAGCFSLEFPDGVSPFYISQDTLELDATKKFFDVLIGGTLAASAGYIAADAIGKRRKKKGKSKGEEGK